MVRPLVVQTSTVVKSIEAITSQCDFMNVAHDPVRSRIGTGSMPWALRILPMVELEMSKLRMEDALIVPNSGLARTRWMGVA